MTHIAAPVGVQLSDRDERARAAVKAFRALQPTLSAFARVMTHNPKVRVEMRTSGAMGSSAATDGERIFYMPPIELGDKIPHVRRNCDKRDDTGLLICPACALREEVLVKIYHEISHICYDSFAIVTQSDKNKALRQAIAEHGTKYAKKLEQAINGMSNHVELASMISPYLKLIMNALEDARIESRLFEGRPGTRTMFKADIAKLFREGVQQPGGERMHWRDYPLNTQACFVMYLLAADYEWKENVHQKIAKDLGTDETLDKIGREVRISRSVADSNRLAFRALARLRELGYCLSDKDPVDEEEQPSPPPPEPSSAPPEPTEDDEPDESDENEDESEDESESESGDGSGEYGFGDPDDPGEDDDIPPEDSDESDEPNDDSDEDEDESESGDSADAEAGDEEAEGDESGGSSTDAGDPGENGDEGSGLGETDDDAESNVEEGEEPASDEGSDDSSSEDDEGEPEPSAGTSGDGSSSEEDEHSPSGSGGPGEFGTGLPQTDSESDVDELPGEGEVDSESASPVAEDEVIDTGADEGEGGIKVEESTEPVPEHGGPEEAAAALDKWLDHEEKPDSVQAREDEEAIKSAVIQGIYFESPSTEIQVVNEFRWAQHPIEDENGEVLSRAWDENFRSPFSGRNTGRETELDVPESLLSDALLRMRIAFSDNHRGGFQSNLKAGKVNPRALGRRAWNDDERLFRRRVLPAKKNYFVVIMMDISGSTVGVNIGIMKHAVMAQTELLERMGIPFAVYAQTGVNRYAPGTYNTQFALDIYVIKDSRDPWDSKAKEALTNLGPDSANLDGHALEYCRKRLDEQSATDRIILYYSDGKMPAANYDEELDILQREIATCRRKRYVLLGVGIRTDSPSRHGLETVQLDTVEDTPKVVDQLGRHIMDATR